MPQVWLAGKVVAPVSPAEEVLIEGSQILFRQSSGTRDALASPDHLLGDAQNMVPGSEEAIRGFYRKYGPFNFQAPLASPGRVWNTSTRVWEGPHAGEYFGQEAVAWARFLGERVKFLHTVGSAFHLRGAHSRRAAVLRRIWPAPSDARQLHSRCEEVGWPAVPLWGRPPSEDPQVISEARSYAQAELSKCVSGPKQPGLAVELVFQEGEGGRQVLKPRILCPTLFQAIGIALIWHLQRNFESRPCECGCGRWIHRFAERGRPRRFYEDRCRWRFNKSGKVG